LVLHASTEGLTRRNLAVLQQLRSIIYGPSPRRFSFNELDTATGSFSPSLFHNHQGEYYGFILKLLNSYCIALVSNSRVIWQGQYSLCFAFKAYYSGVWHSKVFCVGNAGNLVREGDFSNVYRGELQDGRLSAIESPILSESKFHPTLEINGSLSHANIVSLIGYCVENTRLILVYDFIEQRTLQDHLHGTRTRHRNPYLVGESSKT